MRSATAAPSDLSSKHHPSIQPIEAASELPAVRASSHHRTSDSRPTLLTCTRPAARRRCVSLCLNHFLNSLPSVAFQEKT